MHNFKNLKIWKVAMEVTKEVYLLTTDLPQEEKFGLRSQMRRSAISIPSNIAEGAGRNTNGEFKNFLGVANGSSNELVTQLMLSQSLKLISEEKLKPIINKIIEIQKMNYVLIRKYSISS